MKIITLTTEETCEILKVSSITLWRYRRDGILSFIKVRGKVMYYQSDIQKLLDASRVVFPMTI